MEIKSMEATEQGIAIIPVDTSDSEIKDQEEDGIAILPVVVENSERKEPQELESPEKLQETGQDESQSFPPEKGSADSLLETPLDLTIQVTRKRKLEEFDAIDDTTSKQPGIRGMEPVGKRMRPSVISFAKPKSRRIEIHTNADPSEHFLRALGPQLYNMIFGLRDHRFDAGSNYNSRTACGSITGRLLGGSCSCLARTENFPVGRGRLSVDEHFRKSLGQKTWMEVQGFR